MIFGVAGCAVRESDGEKIDESRTQLYVFSYAHRRAAAARGKLARRRLFRHARPGNGGSGVFAAVLGEPAAFSQKVP